MQYTEVRIPIADTAIGEILVAELSEMGYEGFVEADDHLLAYIAADIYDGQELGLLLGKYGLSHSTEVLAAQNWNTTWEANFEPVIVEGFCTVRADFHTLEIDTPYEIVITPKMSFGTGHHATTQLMMMQMKDMDLAGMHVFDFGTGTGILAILAEMLGAADVLAIDIDEWPCENTKENIVRNDSRHITVQQGSLEVAAGNSFDIILANINRNILLMYMEQMYALLRHGGSILMSGLLKEDQAVIQPAAEMAGFVLKNRDELNNWIVLVFEKE